jgi:PAT family beta-lactamase induction signal transducer AmpG
MRKNSAIIILVAILIGGGSAFLARTWIHTQLIAAATNLGYRTAAWLASAAALIIADHFGWRPAFLLLAGIMLAFCLATMLAPSSHNSYQPRSLKESIVEPLRELLGTRNALALLSVVLIFKAGDAFANKLFTPFMMDVGFSKTEIARHREGVVPPRARCSVRCSAGFSWCGSGCCAPCSSLACCRRGQPALLRARQLAARATVMAAAVIIGEHIAGAMGGIALVALIMALCDTRYSAFQYALLSALALLPRYSLGYPAGWIADHGGWYTYYVASFVIALPGLALVWWKRRHIEALDGSGGALPA